MMDPIKIQAKIQIEQTKARLFKQQESINKRLEKMSKKSKKGQSINISPATCEKIRRTLQASSHLSEIPSKKQKKDNDSLSSFSLKNDGEEVISPKYSNNIMETKKLDSKDWINSNIM